MRSPWSRLLLEKITVAQVVKKTFYGTRSFINVFTKARHWALSIARWIQSTRLLSSVRMCSTWCLVFMFSDQNFACISHLLRTTYYARLKPHWIALCEDHAINYEIPRIIFAVSQNSYGVGIGVGPAVTK
jgi:hypothetical protein